MCCATVLAQDSPLFYFYNIYLKLTFNTSTYFWYSMLLQCSDYMRGISIFHLEQSFHFIGNSQTSQF